MGQTGYARFGMAMLAASAAWSCAAGADPVIYRCTSNAHSGVVFVKLDETLKTASMGRGETTMFVPDPATFDRDTVIWTHPVDKGMTWSYRFERATGILTYGPTDRPDLSQQDVCKKK